MSEKFSIKSYSADVSTSADSLEENHDYETSKGTEKLHQNKSQEKNKYQSEFDKDLLRDMKDIDSELDQEIEDLEIFVSDSNLDDFLKKHYHTNKKARDIAKSYLAMQDIMGIKVTPEKLKLYLSSELAENLELSKEDEITEYKEQLSNEGKSSEFILKKLISKYKDDPEVRLWVWDWQ